MLSSLTRNALQVARCRFQTVLHSPARQLCISAQEAAAMVSPMQMSATTIVASPLDEPDEHGSNYRVLFVQRSLKSSFMPGAYVFPGGAVLLCAFCSAVLLYCRLSWSRPAAACMQALWKRMTRLKNGTVSRTTQALKSQCVWLVSCRLRPC